MDRFERKKEQRNENRVYFRFLDASRRPDGGIATLFALALWKTFTVLELKDKRDAGIADIAKLEIYPRHLDFNIEDSSAKLAQSQTT